ncbi:MAG: SUMF1/EgtB/PvdO family nonheme iron enzyme [Planctomycetes bacterium]|nr:SUMF1/EgtB/PvdO family nonheme iron enzyme [Planctomycetota bacterium]
MLLAHALAAALALAPDLKPTPPPGLVWIDAGRTRLGTSVEQALALGQKHPSLFNSIAAETPLHERKVDGFFLMVNEVTNEQYAAFVRATEHRPPRSWGRAALEEAERRFPAEEAERRRKARETGEEAGPDRKFDAEAWWLAHAGDGGWSVPIGEECLPVVFVDYADARAFARWAGLRLMDEFEYQRAGRMNSALLYPWGNDWDDTAYCANQALRESRPRPVGSFPAGATRSGLQDLAGNVWEWTRSPFAAFPGYQELQIRVPRDGGPQVIDSIARFDPARRVIVGGSFQNGRLESRLSARQGADVDAHTDGLGFRCAASETRSIDLARNVVELDLAEQLEKFRLALDLAGPLCVDRWTAEPGTATHTARDENGKPRTEPLPGYAVITAYDYALFLGATELPDSNLAELRERARRDGRVPLGVFSTSLALEEPKLAPGTYVLALAADATEPSLARLSFAKPSGEIAATIDFARLEFGRTQPGSIELTPAALGDATAPDRGPDRIVVRAHAHATVSQRGVSFDFTLAAAPGALGIGWRR